MHPLRGDRSIHGHRHGDTIHRSTPWLQQTSHPPGTIIIRHISFSPSSRTLNIAILVRDLLYSHLDEGTFKTLDLLPINPTTASHRTGGTSIQHFPCPPSTIVELGETMQDFFTVLFWEPSTRGTIDKKPKLFSSNSYRDAPSKIFTAGTTTQDLTNTAI